jgi:flagellar assembly protein FliH
MTRLIRSDAIASGCVPWQAPEVSGPTVRGRAGDADDIRGVRQRAYQEGLEQGRAAGIEAGRRELAARAQALERVLDALARPFEELDHRFHDEIVALVRAVCRQLIRREMRLDPTHVAGVVRESLAALPMSARDIVVRLHPDDAAVVRECLPADSGNRGWRIEPDPALDRGGCLIATSESQIDGRLETRLGRVIATMFEDERKDDAPGADTGE